MEITWQVAPHVCVNAYSSGSSYCALTGRAGCGESSLLLHGWAFIEVGLEARRLTPPLFVPPAGSRWVKDVKGSSVVGLVRSEGSQQHGKEEAWGAGQDRNPSAHAHPPHILAPGFIASERQCEPPKNHLTTFPPFPSSVQTNHLQLVSLGHVSYRLNITFK